MKKVKIALCAVGFLVFLSSVNSSATQLNEDLPGQKVCDLHGSPTGHCVITSGVQDCSTAAMVGDPCNGMFDPVGN